MCGRVQNKVLTLASLVPRPLTAVEKNREKAWDQNYAKLRHRPEMVDSVVQTESLLRTNQVHHFWSGTVLRSFDPRSSPNFSTRLQDKIWEWPGVEATPSFSCWNKVTQLSFMIS